MYPYNTVIEKIIVHTEGNEVPFYLPASMFESFTEWYAEQRGLSLEQAIIELQKD